MPRNPTPAQVEASKRNGAKGRGGKSAESRQKSAQNRRTHGLRAKTFALDHEIAAFGARCDEWHDYYGPRAPATCHLTNEAARATLKADRCDAYEQAVLEAQTKKTRQNWHRTRRRWVQELSETLITSPIDTIAELMSFGHGIVFIRDGFRALIEKIRSCGYLPQGDLQRALCLLGTLAASAPIREDTAAYKTYINNLGCTPGVPAADIEQWLVPAHRPDELRSSPRAEFLGASADECRQWLLTYFDNVIKHLDGEEQWIREEVDEPSLKAALQRASILNDKDARRLGRSHGDARTTYHRATKDLFPMLKLEQKTDPTIDDYDNNDNNEYDNGDIGAEVEAEAAGGGTVAAEVEPEAGAGGMVAAEVEAEAGGGGTLAAAVDVVEDGTTEDASPALGSGSYGSGDEPAAEDQPPKPWFETVPLSASRCEQHALPTEPENPADASSQVIEVPGSSVTTPASEWGRTNGVLSGAQTRAEATPQPEAVGGLPASEGARTSAQYRVAQAGHPAVARARHEALEAIPLDQP